LVGWGLTAHIKLIKQNTQQHFEGSEPLTYQSSAKDSTPI